MAYKILLVDDEKDIVEMLGKRLTKQGYEVAAAFDGEEALEKLKKEDPDIILLDLTMPKLNGLETLREIRHKYTDRWRPVIIISGKSGLDSVKECYGLQADHYLTKPCAFEDILRGIRIMISLIPARIPER